MGRLAKQMTSEIEALERRELAVTESPLGDQGEPRPPALRANGRILLRLSRQEHARLVVEAQAQGVSLNHYVTEIICGRERPTRRSEAHPPRSSVRTTRKSMPAQRAVKR